MKKNEDLISIIVPIFKIEKYMDECINSIVNQTYKNIEIILVDDGSPDKCPQKCDNWVKKDSRISVIHKKNSGLSEARNTGIENANGDYITFVDGDDVINNKMIEILYKNSIENNADLSVCKFRRFGNPQEKINSSEESFNYGVNVYEGEKKFENLFNENIQISIIACTKLYKKELFDRIRFPKNKFHEDVWVAHHVMGKAQRIVFTDAVLYYYRYRNQSITSVYDSKRLDELEGFKDKMNFFILNFPNSEYRNLSIIGYADKIIRIYCLFYYCNSNSKFSSNLVFLKKEFDKYYIEFLRATKSIKKRIKYCFYHFLPYLFYVVNIRKMINQEKCIR